MRTIKFKAKRVDSGEWVMGCLIKHGRDVFIQVEVRHEVLTSYDTYQVIPETVCQFTGVRDSDGNEIYEGDTCMLTPKEEYTAPRYSNMSGVRTVYYLERAGQFQFEDYVVLNWGGWKSVKILHNIHDK